MLKVDRSSWTILLAGCLCLILISCTLLLPTENANILLGNPSNATASIANPNNYLIARSQYVLSYNRDKGIPNWVSWQLNQSWLGTLPRTQFSPDSDLPKSWYQVQPSDYTSSGFDRGHLVPAADRDHTEADRQTAFVMTNIFPQAPDNNRGAWEKLESYCRELVRQGKELYIIAGGAGTGGIGERGAKTTIARGKIAVPASTWKIIVVLDRPSAKLNDITQNTRVIAVNIPNRQGIAESWLSFRTSVDQLETLTGYEFLSKVPTATQAAIESRVDSQ